MNSMLSTLDGSKEQSGAKVPKLIQRLPLRLTLQCLFLGCLISVIDAWTIYTSRATFPPWFCPVALISLAFGFVIIAGGRTIESLNPASKSIIRPGEDHSQMTNYWAEHLRYILQFTKIESPQSPGA